MRITKIIFSAAFFGWGMQAYAQQDIHFSQFYSASNYINPGTAGVFNGDIRAVLNYRSQWKSISEPFNTFTGSVDAKVKETDNGFLGIGAVFYNDKAGASKLTTGHYGINISYALEINKDMYLSLGVQPSFMQKSINTGNLYYGTQFTGDGFNSSLPSLENSVASNFNAFDLGAGMYWMYRPNKETAFYLGAAGAHLTRPNVSFLGATDKLLMKFTFHGGAEFEIPQSNMSILPNFLVKMQGPNRIINLGSDFKYIIQRQSHFTGFINEMSAGLGAYYRVGDAFWGTLFFNWTGFTLAFSYDLNLSDLSVATNGNGGMEFMLMYRAGIGTGKGKTTRFL
jgi:type IX secretion system PorP/SprF family membrane protein